MIRLIKIITKLISLGLISTLFVTSCQLSPPSPPSKAPETSPIETTMPLVDIAPTVEAIEGGLFDLKTNVDLFNQSLNEVVNGLNRAENVDFRSVNLSADQFYAQIKKLKQILATDNVKNKEIISKNLIEIETLLASINKVIKPLQNGLDREQVTIVQQYINFFPRRGINERNYGNFGKTTQEEIALFLNQKINKIDEYLSSINYYMLAEETPVEAEIIPPEDNQNNQNNQDNLTPETKISNLEKKYDTLETKFNNFSEQIKQSVLTLIIIVFIFIVLGATILIVIIYKGVHGEGINFNGNGNRSNNFQEQLSEYQLKFQKNDQQFKQVNQALNQVELQFNQVSQYLSQIEDILIKQFNQRLTNLEKKIQTSPPANYSPLPPSINPITTTNSTNLDVPEPSGDYDNNITIVEPETQLLEAYHQNNLSVLNTTIMVISESINTMNKRREGRDIAPVFEENRRGDLWLVNFADRHYVLPRFNLKINEFSYKTLTLTFHCNNDNLNLTQFEVIKPAQVTRVSHGWELKEMGELKFY